MKVLLFTYEILKKFPLLFTLAVTLTILQGVLAASVVLSIAPIVDIIIHPDLQNVSQVTTKLVLLMQNLNIPPTLLTTMSIFLSFLILRNGFNIIINFIMIWIKYEVNLNLMIEALGEFFQARWSFFTKFNQGMLLNTFNRELNAIADAFGAMVYVLSCFAQLTFYLIVPFLITWQVTLICMVVAFLLGSPILLLSKLNYKLGQLNTSTANELIITMQETLSTAKVILGFGEQRKVLDNLGKTFEKHRNVTTKSQVLSISITQIFEPLGILAIIVAISYSQHWNVFISEVAVVFWSLRSALSQVGILLQKKTQIENYFPSYEQFSSLRNEAKELKQKTGSKLFTEFQQKIVIENLYFTYPGRQETLIDINIHIPKGSMIALVGDSGSGKSTIIDILIGFHPQSQGKVTIDNILLETFDITSYRKRLGYVSQDPVLFNMSIRDNLLWAHHLSTEEEIWCACRQANAVEFIEKLPEKLDTLIGDRGVQLSGGQCQRIALARAILRTPELLILDEATSALDTQSERHIQQAIENISKKTTIVVIAHRLSTITNADHIYVLKEGRIVEDGGYQFLIQQQGYFSQMVKLQGLIKNNGMSM